MLAVLKKAYERKYKLLLIIPILVLLFSVSVLGFAKVSSGEFIEKDITLKGGVLVTVDTSERININSAELALEDALGVSTKVRELKSVGTSSTIGYTFELEKVTNTQELINAIELASGLKLEEGSYTIEETSSSLSASFWQSTIKALLLAFVFMSLVVFFYFRKVVPSLAIVLAAMADLIGVLAFMNILGIRMSTAGVAALLMLLGYSVDSNILLSTRVLKRLEDGNLIERIFGAVKTGLTMQGTTIIALLVIYIITPAIILKQIALVLLIGLLLDMINTWLMNTGILRLYLEKREHG